MAGRTSGNGVAAMVIVGFGMLLIAALSGIALYVVSQRKQIRESRSTEIPSAGSEPAEA